MAYRYSHFALWSCNDGDGFDFVKSCFDHACVGPNIDVLAKKEGEVRDMTTFYATRFGGSTTPSGGYPRWVALV